MQTERLFIMSISNEKEESPRTKGKFNFNENSPLIQTNFKDYPPKQIYPIGQISANLKENQTSGSNVFAFNSFPSNQIKGRNMTVIFENSIKSLYSENKKENMQGEELDEYQELSYKYSKFISPSIKSDTTRCSIEDTILNSMYHKTRSFDITEFNNKYKTEKCKFWELNATCRFGVNCAFAHGSEDMRGRSSTSNYKTKKCKQFYSHGYCPYGLRCQFLHNGHLNWEQNLTYKKRIENIMKLKFSLGFESTRRLKVFENVTNGNNEEDDDSSLNEKEREKSTRERYSCPQ